MWLESQGAGAGTALQHARDFDSTAIARALERGRADAAACLSGWVTR